MSDAELRAFSSAFGPGSAAPAPVHHGNIVSNLFTELKHLGPDLASGIGMLAHDAGKTLLSGGENPQFFTDLRQLGKGIAKSEVNRWGPLANADFKTFWRNTEEDPLGFLLDASTLVTAGGGALAHSSKAEIIAKGADASEQAFKTTGLVRHQRAKDSLVDGVKVESPKAPEPVTLDLSTSEGRLSKAHHEAAGRVVDAQGGVWEQGKANLVGKNLDDAGVGNPTVSSQVELSINPVIRARQLLGVKISNKLPHAPVIGADSRALRAENHKVGLKSENMLHATLAAFYDAASKLAPEERAALPYRNMVNQFRATGASAEDAIGQVRSFYEAKLDELKKAGSDPEKVKKVAHAAGEDSSAIEAMVAQHDLTVPKEKVSSDRRASHELRKRLVEEQLVRRIEDLDSEPIRNLVLQPSEGMLAAHKVLANVSRETTKILYDAGKVGYRKLREGEKADGLVLKPGDPSLVRMSFDEAFKHQQMREARMMMDPATRMKRDLDNTPELTDETVEAYEKWNAAWQEKLDGAVLDEVYVRPHMKGSEVHAMGSGEAGASLREPSTPRGKHNKGFNLAEAADLLQPEGVAIAFKQAMTYKYHVERLNVMSRFMRPWADPLGVKPPKGMTVVKVSDIEKLLGDTRDFLGNDLSIIAGTDDAIAGAIKEFDGLARKALPPDGVHAVVMPERVWNDFQAEFKSVGLFIQRYYDRPMRVWKKFTLAARPVWVTGNFVGSLVTLLATKGLIRGTAAYFQAMRMGGYKGGVFERFAPAVGAGGVYRAHMHDLLDTRSFDQPLASVADPLQMAAKLNDRAKSGLSAGLQGANRALDWVGEFNARITDDIPRRAAMWAELKPQVESMMKEGLSRDEAITRLLSDNQVVDRLIVKTLDDLIDFRTMSRVEKEWIRRAVPFYAWTRGVTSRAFRMALDEPWKLWAMNELGKFGHERSTEFFGGELPSYQRGLIPFIAGRQISSNSLNPAQTVSDTMGMFKAVVSGEPQVGGNNPASQLAPLIKAPMEAMLNRDIFYGTPLQPSAQMLERKLGIRDEGDKSPVPLAALLMMQLLRSFPQERYVEKALPQAGMPLSGSTLYKPSGWDQFWSYVALPIKQTNLDEAHARARAEASGMQQQLY